jgi:hypothetical protein
MSEFLIKSKVWHDAYNLLMDGGPDSYEMRIKRFLQDIQEGKYNWRGESE